MRYSVRNYAQALAEAVTLAEGKHAEEVRKNFLELLRRSGDEARLPKILAEAERLLRRKDGSQRIVVRTARKQKRPARDLVRSLTGPHDAVEEEIDPALIAGVQVIVNDERMFDGSLKTKLEAMFG